jgi:O-antigen/teichoic acid export membrane protein
VKAPAWHTRDHALATFTRNLGTRYALILVNALLGLLILPYNVSHLGKETYGLWMLTATVTSYFTVLELGYGGAVVRFVAEYKARRDARSLNELLSTMYYVYCTMGVACYALAVVVAAVLPYIFHLDPAQTHTGRLVLLIIAVQVALYFPFSMYGGVINGFERYYVNNVVATGFNIATAAVNVLVLWLGYGLVELVAATTLMRVLPFWAYRHNAYKVFPDLQLRWSLFRRSRLREVTGFSAYLAVIDWSARLTYATDAFYLGIFMNTAAVAVYSVAQRLADALFRMTNQLHTFLFPAVIYHAVEGRTERQRSLLVTANRFQLAIAVCLCGAVAALAGVLIPAWVGPGFESGVLAVQILAFVVVLRAWVAMPSTVLKGNDQHRSLSAIAAAGAVANLLLSIPLVRSWGIPGVALGTAIPVTVTCAGVIFPRACRVVGLGVAEGYRLIVWPAVWPAAIAITALTATRPFVPARLSLVLMHLGAGALLYAAIFLRFGLSQGERQWMTSAVHQLWRRRDDAGLAVA